MARWGAYIHSPFCRYKCTYCDFDAGVYPSELVARYVHALCAEIEAPQGSRPDAGETFDTIYFGGGTPSLFCEDALRRILDTIRSSLPLETELEQTIETIPEVVDIQKAEALRGLGFNRVSIGAETFNEQQLRMMGRTHSADAIDEACDILRRAGHSNLNLDLIIGLPGQTLDDWNRTMDRVFALAPEHLSTYMLEVHEETKLGELVRRGKLSLPEEQLVAEMYQALQVRASREGYEQYEISNFALPGFASRHNLKYWSDEPYLGFGSNAHSYDCRARWWNVATPERYIEAMEKRGEAVAERSRVDPLSRLQEVIFLGLRKTSGIDLSELESRLGTNPYQLFKAQFEELTQIHLLECANGHVRLTPKGMILSNEVFVHFV